MSPHNIKLNFLLIHLRNKKSQCYHLFFGELLHHIEADYNIIDAPKTNSWHIMRYTSQTARVDHLDRARVLVHRIFVLTADDTKIDLIPVHT